MLFQGTTITGNHADGNGGGMATSQASGRSFASISFVGATIANNSAGTGVSTGSVGFGGGLYIPERHCSELAANFGLAKLRPHRRRHHARGAAGLGGSPPGVGMTVIDSTISGNSSTLHGGGIYLNAAAHSPSLGPPSPTMSRHQASSEILANGGGIFARSTDVTLVESSLTGNSTHSGRGGGIFLDLGTGDLTVTASTIAGNSARQDGGGVWDGAIQRSGAHSVQHDLRQLVHARNRRTLPPRKHFHSPLDDHQKHWRRHAAWRPARRRRCPTARTRSFDRRR